MFAVIKTGGKQYKVAPQDKITVMSLEGDAGAVITFGEVLALFDGEAHHVGAPLVGGASVMAEIVEQSRGPKVYAFKKRRRKNSKRKRGHRQDLTVVRIVEIVGADGKRSQKRTVAAAEAEAEAVDVANAAVAKAEAEAAPEAAPV